ncbi:hypothetical protein Clacol_003338 [Clathrus columnatus]|uniref:Uncharacterized protein n=1 Tax=Clathrus columnatus TaxID=1419009 RepID=A0AAV5A7X9_9AGAM|nr:hypothetical protein Clacol_003338 [Clathrus columnatus]
MKEYENRATGRKWESYKVLSTLVVRFIWRRTSILNDLHLISKSRGEKDKLPGVAIICGGSIAGLFAAKICANHYKKVLVIEPEKWVTTEDGLEDYHRDSNPPKRSRVAQYLAFHHLPLLITLAMEEMFPTFESELKHIGGKLILETESFYIQGAPTKLPSGYPHYSGGVYPPVIVASRPAFETTLRRLVLRTCKEIEYVNGTVTDLIYDGEVGNNRVTGVKVKLANGETTNMEGSLVVDATGSSQGGFRWLKTLPTPPRLTSLQDLKLSFDPKMAYTTCEFELSPKLEEEFRKYSLSTDSDTSCTVYAYFPTSGEDNRQIIIEKREKNFQRPSLVHFVCGGFNWHGRVQSVDDIQSFLKEMNVKQPLPKFIGEMLDSIRNENIRTSFTHMRAPQSVYIKYHEAGYLPSNFVVVGDALTQSNPINGQGCAKACAHSIILNAQLENVTNVVYFDRDNLKLSDYRFPSTVPIQGEDRLQVISGLLPAYGKILFSLTTEDADVSGVLYRQAGWLEPPLYTLAPWIIRRAAWAWFKRLFVR